MITHLFTAGKKHTSSHTTVNMAQSSLTYTKFDIPRTTHWTDTTHNIKHFYVLNTNNRHYHNWLHHIFSYRISKHNTHTRTQHFS